MTRKGDISQSITGAALSGYPRIRLSEASLQTSSVAVQQVYRRLTWTEQARDVGWDECTMFQWTVKRIPKVRKLVRWEQ